jgi:hypothetical protein
VINMTETRQHATDGDLVRVIDGETAADDAVLIAHVTDCAECSARLARLRAISDSIGELLRATDVAPVDPLRIRPPVDAVGVARLRRRRRAVALWSRPALRAAAAILLLAGVAAASPAARRWIADGIGRLRGAAPTPPAQPRQPSRPAQAASGSRVWFAPPRGPELVVRFETRPASGTLALQGTEDDRASVQVVARASSEALLVLPGEVRVRNSVTSVANYRLTLPSKVRRVRVHVGPADAQSTLVDIAAGTARTIDLTQLPGRQ